MLNIHAIWILSRQYVYVSSISYYYYWHHVDSSINIITSNWESLADNNVRYSCISKVSKIQNINTRQTP